MLYVASCLQSTLLLYSLIATVSSRSSLPTAADVAAGELTQLGLYCCSTVHTQ
jgi:hypothetical protein